MDCETNQDDVDDLIDALQNILNEIPA